MFYRLWVNVVNINLQEIIVLLLLSKILLNIKFSHEDYNATIANLYILCLLWIFETILTDSYKAIPKQPNIKHVMKNKLETTLLEFRNTERSVSVMTSENYAPSAAEVEWEKDAAVEEEENEQKKMRTAKVNFSNKLESHSRPNWAWFNYYLSSFERKLLAPVRLLGGLFDCDCE